MRYPFWLITAYNELADTTQRLEKARENLLVAICSMCKGGADKCDDCVRLSNFTPKD